MTSLSFALVFVLLSFSKIGLSSRTEPSTDSSLSRDIGVITSGATWSSPRSSRERESKSGVLVEEIVILPKYEESEGYCPFANGLRSRGLFRTTRAFDSNPSPDLSAPFSESGEPVIESYSISGEEYRLELVDKPLLGPTSVVFFTRSNNLVVKYQSNCFHTSEVHPLLRDYYFLKFLHDNIKGDKVSLHAYYLSGGTSIPENISMKSQFLMKPEDRDSCVSKGGSVRFMVLERAKMSLFDYSKSFRGGKVPLEKALSIGIKLIENLQSIHSVGVVHNDIHWGNIVFKNSERPLLIDFGRSFFAPESEPQIKLWSEYFHYSPHLSPWEMLGYHKGFRDDVFRVFLIISLLIGGRSEWIRRVKPPQSLESYTMNLLKRPETMFRRSSNAIPDRVYALLTEALHLVTRTLGAVVEVKYNAITSLLKEACQEITHPRLEQTIA